MTTPRKPRLYVLNSPIIPIKNETECTAIVTRTKDLNFIKSELRHYLFNIGYELISAIGHESTAILLSQLLELEIKTNRIAIELAEDDIAIAFTLEFRLPEGKVLSKEELENIINEKKFSFTIIKIDTCWEI